MGFLVATCIQPYSSPQGTSKLCVNLRYEWLADNAADAAALQDPSTPTVPAFQYVESEGPVGPGESSFRLVPAARAQPPISEDIVARMRTICTQLVSYLQRAVPHERVLKVTGEFSLDDTGQLWLVYTSDCRTVPQPLYALEPIPPPAASQGEGTTLLTSLGNSAQLERERPAVTLPDGTSTALHYWGIPDVPAISHREITELKASPNLHPNVQIIAAAVAQCVTGVARSWECLIAAQGLGTSKNKAWAPPRATPASELLFLTLFPLQLPSSTPKAPDKKPPATTSLWATLTTEDSP